ncbi:MAG: tetratricopeptide repeat protein [Candidatus Omnitrophota bacterium]|nr:tetratricopeptide repeat protein [Candidatus Omnitrophota bacterium]
MKKEELKIPFQLNLKEWWRDNWGFFTLLAFLVLMAYVNSLPNAFVSDDVTAIRDNPPINEASFFWSPPILSLNALILFLVHKFFGPNPAMYRLVNIFFQLSYSCVAFFLLSLLFRPPVAFFAAGLFAVHPFLSESVAWISGGNYIQFGLFMLVALFFYILSERSRKYYYLSLLSFIVSLLFTERAFIFPLILVGWELAMGKLSVNWRKILPFFFLGGLRVLPSILGINTRFQQLTTEYALKNRFENPLLQIPIAVSVYLQLIFYPTGFTFFHSKTAYTYFEYGWRVAVFISYLGLVAYCYFSRRRLAFFWLSFFIIPLLPTLTPLRVACHIAERYAAPGALGIFVLLALGLAKLSRIKNLRLPVYIFFSLLLAGLSIRTMMRNTDWKDEHTLWAQTLKVSPNSVNAHNNLCASYVQRGELDKAVQEALIAINLMPTYAHPFNNLGTIYVRMGKYQEAKEAYLKAVTFNPYLWQSYRGLGEIAFEQGEYAVARDYFLKVVELLPRDAEMHSNLGIVYLKLNDKDNAKAEFQKALELNPQHEKAIQILGLIDSDQQANLTTLKK